MKRIVILLGLGYCLSVISWTAGAEGNWRRGNLYYKEVCNGCHIQLTGKPIAPASRTQAEWSAYLKADKHASEGRANTKVSYYTSKAYRDSMEEKIQALILFFDLHSSEILVDIEAHLVHHAKDSDSPSSCM